ncbi:LysR family transcriptional regulator [Streptomyces sp. MMG1121]|uniref:LysR family transcriptional regulator n=1 Tax=Streptomyces sp. MMG1121 TaxID=1415544 RepID=UPI0006AF8CDC|nr:LysR family transcriptional regulator [Streptomyces sp. MMG1121]KOV57854.1 LysR family transcriptional regulator [Streptomyces sp. MMG1121]
MLNLERLRILQAIGVYGSVSGAADVLHVTTSAVSQQIRKLEQETGHQLVKRSGRGVELTFIAQRLAARAEQVLALVEETEAELQAYRSSPMGELTLGAFPTAARGLVPPALRLLAERAPELMLHIRELDFDSPLVQVERGDLDVGLVQDWEHVPITWPTTVRKKLLMTDGAKVALPATHRLADRPTVRIADLVDEEWISRVRRSTCHEWLLFTMREHGTEPRIVHTVNEHPTQLALVAAGVGLAMVPTLGLAPLPAGARVLPIEPQLTRRVYAVWRAEGSVRPSVRATVDALSAVGEELSRGTAAPVA